MENKKTYGFYGIPSYDFIIYLASILINLGMRVLVIDHSKQQEVMSCYVPPEEEIDFFQYKEVDYVNRMEFSSIDTFGYDYIFVYQDETIEEDINYEGVFVISDFDRNNLKKAGDYIKKYDGKVHFYIRDFCKEKFNKQYIIKDCLNIDTNLFDYNVIELDYYDFFYRINMTHEYYQEFKELSKNYKKCLLNIANWMANPSKKSLHKAYRLAERGKSIGNSFLE